MNPSTPARGARFAGILLIVLGWMAGAVPALYGCSPSPPDPSSASAERSQTDSEGAAQTMSAGHHAEGGKANRLARESSPYLLLHQFNPVDWYPWGPEALERAKKEGKPIFLSVGYSTCYWCHVMERQSFSDPEIAALMNRNFVNIKVDREERPDLDEIYMAATQLLTGHGGWPNSVFLTPDLKPFYAGTYFPPRDQHGRPGFGTLVMALSEAWKNRRADVETQAEEVADAIRRYLEDRNTPGEAPPSPEVAKEALASLAGRYDEQWSGFGGAPKFPTPSNLFLLREMAEEDDKAASMLAETLDQMARGGIYDQLAGGFHRYATDREWKVPHFEKMLYDNGLLLELYAREHQRTGEPELARIARETADFLIREMTGEHGAFWSAIDAETDGKEGAYYVWTRAELEEILGEEDATFLAPLLGFDGPPFFEGDHYVLHLPQPLHAQAERRRMSREELLGQIVPLRARLLTVRDGRDRPLTDDKVLTDWNGMAIAGMASAGEALGDDALIARAGRAADFILKTLRAPEEGSGEDVLLHSWREGQGKIPAYLGDYAFFVHGLLALHRVSGEERWLAAAQRLTEEQIRRLRDPAGGFFVAVESPDLMARSKDVADGATPSPNAVTALNLLELAERTEDPKWRQEARALLQAFAPVVQKLPEAVRMLTVAARRFNEPQPAGGTRQAEAAPAPQSDSLVSAELMLEPDGDEGARPFRLRLVIAPGWHVNANPATNEFLIPTSVEATEGELTEVHYPAGKQVRFPYADEPLAVYEGEIEITGTLPATGEPAVILTYQPCDDSRCLPPVREQVRR